MRVKPCNIRIPSSLSDAQVAADAACAAKRYAYSAEQVESRLNSYVEDLTGLDLEQIAANTAAAADVVERAEAAATTAQNSAEVVERLATEVKDMHDALVEQDLEQLRQDIAEATDLIATVDGKVAAAQQAAENASEAAENASQSYTAAEYAMTMTWAAYSAVLSEKETASADFKADAEGKVAAAVEAQLNPGGDFYAAVRATIYDTIPTAAQASVDTYLNNVTSEGGRLYDYVEGAIESIATAESEAIASIEAKVDADIAEKINPEYISEKVEDVLPGLIDAELADENGVWNREKTAAIEAATAQAELSQTYAQNASESAERAEGSASSARTFASAALTSEYNAYSRVLDATAQAELARQWAISEEHVAGLAYSGAMFYAKEAATYASKAATAEDNARSYSIYVREQAELAAASAQSAYTYSMKAALHELAAVNAKEAAEQSVIDARAAMNQASDSAQAAEGAKKEAVLQAQQANGAAAEAAGSYNSVLEAYSGVLDAYASTLDVYSATKAAMADAQGYAADANATKESISLIVDSANWHNQNISVDAATGAFTTTPGAVYAVWCKEGCAIYKDAAFTDKFCTIWAEEQRCFMATQTSYYVYPITLADSISINTAYYLRAEN